MIREILYFQPRSRKTDYGPALDFVNRVVRRRAVNFLISDFCLANDFDASLENMRPKLQALNKRHDVVAVAVNDPRESEIPDIGLLTIEDAETGEQVELDTSRQDVRDAFADLSQERRQKLKRGILSTGVELLELSNDQAYLPALLGFFKNRERRINR